MPGDPSREPVGDYQLGPYRFDGRLRRLTRDGEPVVLTPKAVDTLVALVERAGRVVEKDELLRVVWGDVVVGEDTLAQNISTLRRVFGDDPASPQFIATIPRRGYKFVGVVEAVQPESVDNGPGGPRGTSRATLPWAAAVVGFTAMAVSLAAFSIHTLTRDDAPRSIVEFTIPEPESGRFHSGGGMLTVSPDGKYLAYLVVDESGSTSIWLRPLASSTPRRLDGTEGAANPFWSPDSRSIAFFSERRLKSVEVSSGTVRVMASPTSGRSLGGSWGSSGHIIFSVPAEGMYLVDAMGGVPERLEVPMGGCDRCAIMPSFLPDGRRFLYTVATSDVSPVGVYVAELGTTRSQLVIDTLSSASYVAPGFVSYARSGTLYLHRFDPAALRLTGTAIPISDGVSYNARTGRVVASVSDRGVVAFRRAPTTELVWVDRAGRMESIAAPAATYHDFAIGPDGRRVAVARVDPRTGTSDILVFDNGREIRVTDDAAWDGDPIWSEDGEDVVYSSRRGGKWQIYRRSATAVGVEELLYEADTPVTPLQVLRSNHIVYNASSATSRFDTWRLAGRESTPVGLLKGFSPSDARVSPDEQWVAYGKPEAAGGSFGQTVYVSRLPFGTGETLRVVAEEASTPRWREDGRELFYLSRGSTVIAVPVDPGGTPGESAPRELFVASRLAPTGISGYIYDVTRDGRRFLLKREVGSSPIHVIVNWDARLSRAEVR